MRVATINVTIDVGVSYTSVSSLPDPLRAIGGLFSVALSVALPRLAVSQHPVLWSSDFPLGYKPSDRLPPPRVPMTGVAPAWGCPHHVLSVARLLDPPHRQLEGRFRSPLPGGVSCRAKCVFDAATGRVSSEGVEPSHLAAPAPQAGVSAIPPR